MPRFTSRSALHDISALTETGFAPAVEHAVDQMVGYGEVLGDTLMTLFAFPGLSDDSRYLLEYSSHVIAAAASPFASL